MSHSSENPHRAVLLTPPGTAAIAVVRLLGPGAGAFLAGHFSKPVTIGRCVHGQLLEGDQVIDDPVVVLHEKGADLCLHGGPWVIQKTLELAQRGGFTLMDSTSPPVCQEAIDAGSLLEREMLSHLPLATTEPALRALLNQPSAWARWRENPSDDSKSIAADRSLWFLLHPPRVAIVGAANVGKSTLANQLFAQERSITADLPGTTRDWVGELANLDGLAVMLLDTPGIRQTADAVEAQAIQAGLGEIAAVDLVVIVLDVTANLPEQQSLLSEYPAAIVVLNKTDREFRWDPDQFAGIRAVATTGAGVEALRRAIRARFDCQPIDVHRPRWWTRRQREILHRAVADRTSLQEL